MIRFKIAPHLARTKRMVCFWAFLTLALHLWPGIVAPAHGQGSRKDDIVFNSRGIPLAGATVRVCSMPATGQPCTPLAQIYSDSGLTQALANPITTDGLGNYFFYAAPGKYEIEVSGPSITTKQIPNVILPNDPSSPTFSSVSSTGAISAFSLNLTGNLTVNGSTTVIGNLASGTLNLTNQSTPPGAASSGTVNLYTKSADKKLYYKDDTGTEQGPLGSGAQTNAINTFTAAQNFDSDIHTKGPNPWFDLTRYGGYSASSPPSTTGSISSGSTTLTLANAQDFANGQGIVVYGAGPATSLTTPGTPTVTPVNLVNGSTSYAYKVIAEDRFGGLTVTSGAGSTTTGAATLGSNNVTLTSCVRTNGLATYTSSSNHNLQVGTQVQLSGFTGGTGNCNGVKTIASVPSGTTFTTSDGAVVNENNTSGGAATVIACNTLTYAGGSFSGFGTLHYWIYRSVNSGAYSLAGVAVGIDPWWQDCGQSAPTAPSYVPGTAPSSTQAGYLVTTISSGGGTTTLTLATAASTTVSSQTVLHDNSKALLAAMQAAYNNAGGEVFIPNAGAAFNAKWPFNATTDMTTLSLGGSFSVRVHVNSDQVQINQPWVLRSSVEIEGEPHDTTSFQYVNNTQVGGSANPIFLLPAENASGVHISKLFINGGASQQVPLLSDEGTDGGGNVGLVLDDTTLSTNAYGPALLLKAGFDFFINRGVCGTPGSGSFNGGSCIRLTNSSPAVISSNSGQIPGRVRIDGMYFSNTGIVADCLPGVPQGGGIDGITHVLFESQVDPLLRINCSNGLSGFYVAELSNVTTADIISGDTPLIDAQNGSANMAQVTCRNCVAGSGNPPLVIGPYVGQEPSTNFFPYLLEVGNSFGNPGNLVTTYTGGGLSTSGEVTANDVLEVPMANPLSAPNVAVSSGGSVPTGSVGYAVQFFDVNGNGTAISPLGFATTTSGNQTVTITEPAPPAGAVTWEVFREVNCPSCGPAGILNGIAPVSTTTIVDSSSGIAGNSPVVYPGAGLSAISANGVSGPGLTLVNNNRSWATTFPKNLTVNRIISVPDNAGYLEVSSYVNSVYDNFNRANGGLGSNWTGFTNCSSGCISPQISSNQVTLVPSFGTGGALYTAQSFAADQFAELTLTSAPNSNLDVHLLVRGALAGNGSIDGYGCRPYTNAAYIFQWTNGSATQLATVSMTANQGDVYRCEAQGSTITMYQNGVSVLTATDTTWTAPGNGGIYDANGNDSSTTIDNFSTGNLHPLGHLDVEQDWTKTQHFESITIGPPNTATAVTHFEHQRSTQSVGAGARVEVLLSWPWPFADTSYTAVCSVEDSTTAANTQGLVYERIRTKSASQVGAVVFNPTGGSITATVDCAAWHN